MIKAKCADSNTVCLFIEASRGGVLSLRTAFKADLAPSDSAASDFLLSTRRCHGKIAAAALEKPTALCMPKEKS